MRCAIADVVKAAGGAVITPTPRIGALQGLWPLEVADLSRYKAAVARGGQSGFGYYFPYLLTHQRAARSTVLRCEDDGCWCVFVHRRGERGARLDVLLAPTPMDPKVARRCLERANDFNDDRSARILRIDAKDAARVAEIPGVRLKERKAQYVYEPRALGELSGNRYRTLRRHVASVRRLPGVEVVPYSEAFASDCRALLHRWEDWHRREHGTAGGVGTTARIIDLAGVVPAPDLLGEVVLVEGRLVAFAFGGEIRPGLACFVDAKTDHLIPGLAYFQRYSFLSSLGALGQVNDGSDAGRAGLRQMKESLRPVSMHLEYRGSQVAAS